MIIRFKFADGRDRTLDAKDAPLQLIMKEEIERKFVMKRDMHDKPIYVEELRPYFNGEGPLGGLASSIAAYLLRHRFEFEAIDAQAGTLLDRILEDIEAGNHLKEHAIIVPDGIA